MRIEQTNANQHLRCLIYVLFVKRGCYSYDWCCGTRSRGSIRIIISSTADAEGVGAVVTAARHTRLEPRQYRCACVSSTILLKMGTSMLAAKTR